MPSFELLALICLIAMAVGNLMVGVINDAVNFVGPALGAKVAKRKTIFMVAGLGLIIGAAFSDGIIEVARKGIFHPEFFTLNEAIILFTAVALTDIVILDLFSTFGLPTSTTVTVIFELFGAALALAWVKTGTLAEAFTAINVESAVKVMSGIFLSIVVAFLVGLLIQFITRAVFSFKYQPMMKKIGFLWTGLSLTALFYFILIQGGKHANFLTSDHKQWIVDNSFSILGASFVVLSLISLILIKRNFNILKLIILIGTCALATAFAGNDLANFIGVSIAGTHAYLGNDLAGTLPTPTIILILAGLIMSFTMYFSKKADTVTNMSLKLASHEKEIKKVWGTNRFVEGLCNMVIYLFEGFTKILPKSFREWLGTRFDSKDKDFAGDFDLLRGSVALMVSAAIISLATAYKLPLSTTFVTFIVVMATALADGAWSRDCAPSRVSGILTIVAGWMFTAVIATVAAGLVVTIIHYLQSWGLAIVVVAVVAIIYKLLKVHKKLSAAKGI